MSKEKNSITLDQITDSPYVLGVRKQDKFKVIDVQLQADWEIPEFLFPENTEIFINVDSSLCCFFSEKKQFSDIFSIINEVIRYNQEKEEKIFILNKLQLELQHMFDEMGLNEFKTVTITFTNGQIYPKINNKKTDILKEANVDIQVAIKETEKDGEILKP